MGRERKHINNAKIKATNMVTTRAVNQDYKGYIETFE